jgi:hypothetical protein
MGWTIIDWNSSTAIGEFIEKITKMDCQTGQAQWLS